MARRGKKGLSAEDLELWAKVAKTASPLHPASRLPAPQAPPDTAKKTEAGKGHGTLVPRFHIGEKAAASAPPHHPGDDLSNRIAHAPVRMDHGTHRRMLRGKLKPEARIDLHGMTLANAHPALTRFILESYDAGHRLVLVITGKGRGGADDPGDGPIPIRRGVLRQQVPGWLHAPPLGAVVLDIREAHQRHGGGGAYYVYLKKRR